VSMSAHDGREPTERDPLQRVAGLLSRLPGIGEKSALRLGLSLVRADPQYLAALADAIRDLHRTLRMCEVCCDFSPDDVCARCRDARRDRSVICVVAQPQDRMAIERTGVFRGLYHVLHGVLDPLGGVGPAELRVDALLRRLERHGEPQAEVTEIIVATSPNVEGDATALYLSKLIAPLGIRVSRIASGVAVGGELEYADVTTLHRALEDRRTL
jgi:recombination protein RecR